MKTNHAGLSRPTLLKRTTLTLLVMGLLVAACGGSSGGDIDGNWQLVSGTVDSVSIEPESNNPLTIDFDGADFSGHAGCNSFTGSFTQDGSDIELGEIAMTQMACEALDLETLYTAALSKVETASVDGGELTLSGPNSELVFESAPSS
jgi:heat shock protein HslJ